MFCWKWLQDELNDIVHWCKENKLDINVFKYKVLRFSSTHLQFWLFYRREQAWACYNGHINKIVLKANKLLRFILRYCWEFGACAQYIVITHLCILISNTVLLHGHHITILMLIESRMLKKILLNFCDFYSLYSIQSPRAAILKESDRCWFDAIFCLHKLTVLEF